MATRLPSWFYLKRWENNSFPWYLFLFRDANNLVQTFNTHTQMLQLICVDFIHWKENDEMTCLSCLFQLSGTGEYHVNRTYDDFEWLQQHLFSQEDVPGIQGVIVSIFFMDSSWRLQVKEMIAGICGLLSHHLLLCLICVICDCLQLCGFTSVWALSKKYFVQKDGLFKLGCLLQKDKYFRLLPLSKEKEQWVCLWLKSWKPRNAL